MFEYQGYTYHEIVGKAVAFPKHGETAPCPPGYVRDDDDPDLFHKEGTVRQPCKSCRGL